jgi:hypothetical protein
MVLAGNEQAVPARPVPGTGNTGPGAITSRAELNNPSRNFKVYQPLCC